MNETYFIDLSKIDFRVREIETRNVTNDDIIYFENRTIIHELDGTKKYGEWLKSSFSLKYEKPNKKDCISILKKVSRLSAALDEDME